MICLFVYTQLWRQLPFFIFKFIWTGNLDTSNWQQIEHRRCQSWNWNWNQIKKNSIGVGELFETRGLLNVKYSLIPVKEGFKVREVIFITFEGGGVQHICIFVKPKFGLTKFLLSPEFLKNFLSVFSFSKGKKIMVKMV